MSFSIGIVGLPNVGKSTLFNALTKNQVPAENYPFCTIDPNVGVVKVPDERLTKLAATLKATKVIPTVIEFVDIAGLVKGASKGEGLGNKFLSHIREVDAICQVVRDFEDKNVTHVYSRIDPKDDLATINTELILADLAAINSRLVALKKELRGQPDKLLNQLPLILSRIEQALKTGKLAREVTLVPEEKKLLKELNLLTLKPTLYLRNINDKSKAQASFGELSAVVTMNVKLEAELNELSTAEAKLYRQELGIQQSGLDQLILAAYQVLDLVTFYSASYQSINQAWTVKRGATAPEAAGVIHSDFERGFIRAEIINWQDLIKAGGETAAREQGSLRTEGKNYIIQDGDVCHFLFNK